MHRILNSILFCLLILSIGCSSNNKQPINDAYDFLSTKGVEISDSTLDLYIYQDTLYYFDNITKLLFKIPDGFEANNQDTYWGNGLRLVSKDSLIKIYIDSYEQGSPVLENDEENDLYSWWSYCWDNKDIKTDVKGDKYGYTKIGFDENQNCKPIYEKCVMYHDVDSGWRPHLIRIEYPDSLASEAADIIWNYIAPYPNIFYPKSIE